jgi:hypothetical protein
MNEIKDILFCIKCGRVTKFHTYDMCNYYFYEGETICVDHEESEEWYENKLKDSDIPPLSENLFLNMKRPKLSSNKASAHTTNKNKKEVNGSPEEVLENKLNVLKNKIKQIKGEK